MLKDMGISYWARKLLKSLTVILLISAIGLSPIAPNKASAALLTFEINPNLFIQPHFSIIEWFIEEHKREFLEFLKYPLIDNIENHTRRWVQGILTGNCPEYMFRVEGKCPKWITSWESYFQRELELSENRFIKRLENITTLPEPFKQGLKRMLTPIGHPEMDDIFEYTLDDIVDPVEFYNDFSTGGFDAFVELLLPNNNPMGMYLMALEQFELARGLTDAASEAEGVGGSGYYATKDCFEMVDGVCMDWKNTSPPSTIQHTTQRMLDIDMQKIINARDPMQVMFRDLTQIIMRFLSIDFNGLLRLSWGYPDRPKRAFPSVPPPPSPRPTPAQTALPVRVVNTPLPIEIEAHLPVPVLDGGNGGGTGGGGGGTQ